MFLAGRIQDKVLVSDQQTQNLLFDRSLTGGIDEVVPPIFRLPGTDLGLWEMFYQKGKGGKGGGGKENVSIECLCPIPPTLPSPQSAFPPLSIHLRPIQLAANLFFQLNCSKGNE